MSNGTRSTPPHPHPHRRRHRRGHRFAAALLALGLLTTVAPAPPAQAATPAEQKRAEAKRIAGQRQALTQEAERLNEQAKQTEDQLAALAVRIAETDRQLGTQRQAADAISREAARLAMNAYVRGDVSDGIGAALAEDGATNLQLHRGYTPVALGGSTDVLDQARAVQQDTEVLAETLQRQERQQEDLQATLETRQRAVAATQTKLEALARQVDAELTQLVIEEQEAAIRAAEAAAAEKARRQAEELARQAEAERAARAARTTTTPAPAVNAARAASPATTPASTAAARPGAGAARPAAPAATAAPTTAPARAPRTTAPPAEEPDDEAPAPRPVIEVPPTSPAAAIAVAEALAQLGKRYVFGAAGPDVFDCSGLTQWAWAKAGVSMPHYTVSQFRAFPQVPLDQLQPGDLVFFNVNLGHMGMYIGNGNYVHSPRTGDVVKISTLAGRNTVGAVRPG